MKEPVSSGHTCRPDSSDISAVAASEHAWVSFDYHRGVFAQRQFAQGEVIETAPVMAVPREQLVDMERAQLTAYCCTWGEGVALVLGLIPLYGYSDSPNAVLIKKIEALTIEVVALRDIAAGEAMWRFGKAMPEPSGWRSAKRV